MSNNKLTGKKILITAGPTQEAIDEMRFISNHATGKMGYALAEEFLTQGAEVTLVSGPVCLSLQHPHLNIIHITTAAEMYLACCRFFESADVAVFTAAVTDFRPAKFESPRIWREDVPFRFKMVKNVDIACEFGKVKRGNQLSIGVFAEKAGDPGTVMGKISKKNFDMVVLQSMNDNNKISIIKDDLSRTDYPLKSRKDVAKDILFEIMIALSHSVRAEWEEKEQAYEMMYR